MTIESLCIEVCQTSEDGTTCIGCHRTLSEIAMWQKLSDEEKIRVIATAQERKADAKRKRAAKQTP